MKQPSLILALSLALIHGCAEPALVAAPQSLQSAPDNASEMIAKVRRYAADYIDRLPNFLCTQTTVHWTAGRKGDRWRKKNTIAAQLVFADSKENRTVQAVNGKPVTGGSAREIRETLTTQGEFGILLANILGPDSAAEISWKRVDTMRGHDVAVIRYSMDQEHSTIQLSRNSYTSAFIAYYGEVFFDPVTGVVLRIVKHLADIPPELETEDVLTVIDYDKVVIAGIEYFLPSTASVEMTIRSGRLKNEMSFNGYRKFEANSTITFQP